MYQYLSVTLLVILSAEKNGPDVTTKLFRDYFETNPIGAFHLFNLFTPLLLKGKEKKAAAITSGHADLPFATKYRLENVVAYASSKAAQNMIVGKFHNHYAQDGVLFVSICPGVVDTAEQPGKSTLFHATSGHQRR